MTAIYIDADACPVREEVYKVAVRLGLTVHVVSNGSRPIRPPGLPNVRMTVVSEGADKADDWIAERAGPGDVTVTADIPLAARCLERKARVVAPNGRVWDDSNIGAALAGRELSRHLRELGIQGGQPPMNKQDRSNFLVALDRVVQAAMRDAG